MARLPEIDLHMTTVTVNSSGNNIRLKPQKLSLLDQIGFYKDTIYVVLTFVLFLCNIISFSIIYSENDTYNFIIQTLNISLLSAIFILGIQPHNKYKRCWLNVIFVRRRNIFRRIRMAYPERKSLLLFLLVITLNIIYYGISIFAIIFTIKLI